MLIALQAPNILTMITYIEAQGSLLRMRVLGAAPREKHGGGIRGRIHKFSQKSRQRLLRLFARMRMKGVRATFITLTFRRYPTNREAKRSLKAFVQYIRDNYPNVSLVWRMEYQGRGAIHFHLLCFNLPYWDWKEILATWKSCSNQDRARIDVRLVRSRNGVMHYVSKYIAKPDRKHSSTFFIHAPYQQKGRHWRKGRFWGYVNKNALPFDQKVEGVLTDNKAIKRLSNAAWEIIGRETRYNSISFHLFIDSAKSIAMRNISTFGRFLEELGSEFKDHLRPKPKPSPYTSIFSDEQLETKNRLVLGKLSRAKRSEACAPLTLYRTMLQKRTIVRPNGLSDTNDCSRVKASAVYKQELTHASI